MHFPKPGLRRGSDDGLGLGPRAAAVGVVVDDAVGQLDHAAAEVLLEAQRGQADVPEGFAALRLV